MAQAHRIPGLLPHGPAGPTPVATGCGDARGPPDGLAANADHLRHLGQRRGASRPAMAHLGAVVVAHPTAGSAPRPDRGVHPEPRGHVLALGPPRPERGVVGLGCVSIGPGVVFLSALGEPGHFSAADVIRRPLGDPCGRALRRLLLERGEMRLARHEPPYGRHSPRCPVMGLAGHLALRAAAHPREGPRGRAHSWAAQDGYAPRGGTRASTFRENTNGSSGICVGCRIGKDAKLAAAALAQSLFSRPRGRRPPGGAAGIPWRLSHSCHPTPCASQLASQLARSSRRNSVHKCPKTAPRGRFCQSVYTPASPRLSTTAQQCTQMVQNSSKRPF